MLDQICHKGTKPAFIAYFGIFVLDLDDDNQYALLFTLVLFKRVNENSEFIVKSRNC
jgi:hypothetical protein